jgi:rubrerythrin
MEREAREFYVTAAGRATDVSTRKLLGDLAAAEAGHQATAGDLVNQHLDPQTRQAEDLASRRQLILTWIQPGLKNESYYLAERSYRAFERWLPLPESVDEAKVKAKFDKGVLKITAMKKPEANKAQRKIEINKAS